MFKDIPGYEGLYEISDEGVVRSKVRWINDGRRKYLKKEKIIKPDKHIFNGRLRVMLYKNGVRRKHSVHRLVLETYIGPCPDGKICCHKDDNYLNNTVDNLYWGSVKDNNLDRIRNDKTVKGSLNGNSKLKDEEVWLIKKLLYHKVVQRKIAQMFKVTPTMISYIKQNKQWSHITYNEDEERKKIK